jgi:uncharacterized protein YggE
MKNKTLIVVSLILMLALAACSPGLGTIAYSTNSKTDLGESPVVNTVPSQSDQTAESNVRTIHVTGSGSVTIVPDIAYINIGVHTEDANVSSAITANNETVQKVKDALMKSGVAEVDIQTTNFSVYANQTYSPTGEASTRNYAVDNTLSVKVRDLQKLGSLLGDATNAGANNIYGITFDVADRTQSLEQARKLALDNARQQATNMAADMNVTLGDVQSAVVNLNNYTPYYGMGGGGAEAAATNVPISAGQLVITVTVDMSFQIQ